MNCTGQQKRAVRCKGLFYCHATALGTDTSYQAGRFLCDLTAPAKFLVEKKMPLARAPLRTHSGGGWKDTLARSYARTHARMHDSWPRTGGRADGRVE